MRLKTTSAIFLSAILLATLSRADMQPIKKLRAGAPPYAITEKIIRHNDRIITGAPENDRTKTPGTPHIVWLADCDARIQPTLLYPEPVDTIYTVRNPGNQLQLSAGAIDYGVNELFSPVLLITGNTSSDSLRLFSKGYNHLEPDLRRDLDGLKLSLGEQTAASGDGRKTDPLLVEKNVDFQVNAALQRYGQRVENGRLVIIGGIIDLDNQYGFGRNRLLIININGETDPGKLRAKHLLTRLDKRLLGLVGKRAGQR